MNRQDKTRIWSMAAAAALAVGPAHAQLAIVPGDVNGDGIVNGQDIALIASNWSNGWGPGDGNQDGIVNGQDIALVASNWLKTGPTFQQVVDSLPAPPASAYTSGYNAANLQQIGLTQSIAAQANYGEGVTIGVVDTGIQVKDPQFAGRLSPLSTCAGADLVTNAPLIGCNSNNFPKGIEAQNSHGEVVAGIAAGANPLQIGVAPKATIMVVNDNQTIEGHTGINFGSVGQGIISAATLGAAVINVSAYPALQELIPINYAADKGSIIVLAAGNNGSPYFAVNRPIYGLTAQALSHLIVVGAVNPESQIESWSNTPGTTLMSTGGTAVDPTAPTVPLQSIWLMAPDRVPNVGSGTSYAAPVVAGAVVLLDSRWPILVQNGTSAQVLFATATDLGAPGVDPIYGNGLLNLQAAFQPVGNLSVATQTGNVSVNQLVSSIQASGPLGLMQVLQLALTNYTVFDSFSRDFKKNLSYLVNYKPSAQSLAQTVTSPQAKVSSTRLADGSSLSFGNQDVVGNGVDKPMGHAADENWMVSFTDANGSTVAAGQGFPASASFAGAMWGTANSLSTQSSSLGVANAVASLAEGGMFTAVGTNIGKNTRLAFGWSETKASDPLSGNDWIAPNANAFNAGFITKITNGWTGGLSMSMLSEQSGLLGSVYDQSGPINFGSKNQTMSMGVSSGFALGEKTDLLLEAAIARTNGSTSSNSLLSSVSPLYARSYGASLAERDVIDNGDRFELTVKAPLKVYSGSASLTVDSVAADGTPISGSQIIGLKPNGSELDLGMAYHAPVRNSFEWNASLTARHDADNVAGNTDVIGLVGVRLTF